MEGENEVLLDPEGILHQFAALSISGENMPPVPEEESGDERGVDQTTAPVNSPESVYYSPGDGTPQAKSGDERGVDGSSPSSQTTASISSSPESVYYSPGDGTPQAKSVNCSAISYGTAGEQIFTPKDKHEDESHISVQNERMEMENCPSTSHSKVAAGGVEDAGYKTSTLYLSASNPNWKKREEYGSRNDSAIIKGSSDRLSAKEKNEIEQNWIMWTIWDSKLMKLDIMKNYEECPYLASSKWKLEYHLNMILGKRMYDQDFTSFEGENFIIVRIIDKKPLALLRPDKRIELNAELVSLRAGSDAFQKVNERFSRMEQILARRPLRVSASSGLATILAAVLSKTDLIVLGGGIQISNDEPESVPLISLNSGNSTTWIVRVAQCPKYDEHTVMIEKIEPLIVATRFIFTYGAGAGKLNIWVTKHKDFPIVDRMTNLCEEEMDFPMPIVSKTDPMKIYRFLLYSHFDSKDNGFSQRAPPKTLKQRTSQSTRPSDKSNPPCPPPRGRNPNMLPTQRGQSALICRCLVWLMLLGLVFFLVLFAASTLRPGLNTSISGRKNNELVEQSRQCPALNDYISRRLRTPELSTKKTILELTLDILIELKDINKKLNGSSVKQLGYEGDNLAQEPGWIVNVGLWIRNQIYRIVQCIDDAIGISCMIAMFI